MRAPGGLGRSSRRNLVPVSSDRSSLKPGKPWTPPFSWVSCDSPPGGLSCGCGFAPSCVSCRAGHMSPEQGRAQAGWLDTDSRLSPGPRAGVRGDSRWPGLRGPWTPVERAAVPHLWHGACHPGLVAPSRGQTPRHPVSLCCVTLSLHEVLPFFPAPARAPRKWLCLPAVIHSFPTSPAPWGARRTGAPRAPSGGTCREVRGQFVPGSPRALSFSLLATTVIFQRTRQAPGAMAWWIQPWKPARE